jgi:8-oxo-dGTP diphosphatase
MARRPILAAGGIVFRAGTKPQIAVVQRSKDNSWVLPKGKLKQKENAISAARREASEETGYDVEVCEFLGVTFYWTSGRPKVVHFWRMQAADAPGRTLTSDVKALKWLPLASAIERLSTPHEFTPMSALAAFDEEDIRFAFPVKHLADPTSAPDGLGRS